MPLNVNKLGGIEPVAAVFGNGGVGVGPQTSFAVYVHPGGTGLTETVPVKDADVAVIFDAVGAVIVSVRLLRSPRQLVGGHGSSTLTFALLGGILNSQS